MRKRIVIEGELCDVCGRVAGPKHMYVGGYNDWAYVPPKSLTIKMDGGPFNNIVSDPPVIRGKPRGKPRAREYGTVCPVCAFKLSEMFQSWLDECWKDGEKERMERRLRLEEMSEDEHR